MSRLRSCGAIQSVAVPKKKCPKVKVILYRICIKG